MKRVLCLCCFLLLCVACSRSGLSSGAEASAREVLRDLQKLKAATEVGVNYQLYGSLMIDAKAQMTSASAQLPDGDVKTQLALAMDAYADALAAWTAMMSLEYHSLLTSYEPGQTLIPKYSIPVPPGDKTVNGKLVLSVIWAAAGEHVDHTVDLLNGRKS
jgi:hypothetical protein